jgi:hypothetical protein
MPSIPPFGDMPGYSESEGFSLGRQSVLLSPTPEPQNVPVIGASGDAICGCTVVSGWGIHTMINVLIALASVSIIAITALLGRRFIDRDDADQYGDSYDTSYAEAETGWIPTGIDELVLAQTRREMATYTKSSGLTY